MKKTFRQWLEQNANDHDWEYDVRLDRHHCKDCSYAFYRRDFDEGRVCVPPCPANTAPRPNQVVRIPKSEFDEINKPKHYNSSKAECKKCGTRIECIWIVQHMAFDLGNVVKYIWRYTLKNGLQDLKKAQWYLNNAIERIEHEQSKTKGSFTEGPYKHTISEGNHKEAGSKDC